MDSLETNPVETPPRLLSERLLLLLLAAVQFTHIMDFMVMMPLGPQLMRELGISPEQFGNLISAFSLTAGIVGFSVAPFLDRFDRRHLLLFCYAGFALGTLACGLSHTVGMLMLSRALCGAFGGVSGATLMAIVADVVPPERRARGMGIIMTAFSAAAALGVPFGLKLAQLWKWEAPFLTVATVAGIVWIMLWKVLPPVRGHLRDQNSALSGKPTDFFSLLANGNAWMGMLLMTMAIFGHFTVIPYLSYYLKHNVGMDEKNLFLFYLVGGWVSIFTGPRVGHLADRFGKLKIYAILVACASAIICFLTNTGPLSLTEVLLLSAVFFIFASGRFIPVQATVSLAVPTSQRGAYMSLISCSRDLGIGITAFVGGKVVIEGADEKLLHFNWLGWIAITVSVSSLLVFRKVRAVE
ncbi:MFS transporter [Luteolibacter pohnpeiensis]|uniref:MFS transporter n=1 Tax=Luteolibacter pohnpeiensis TaxID=454153 RepID=A0A934S7K1_9BACT|nr:MFS transporter [Luteolibacter pohnpeiensis]MBK1882256.1 MFS transporter [Luteolibacter pohnpeiensis]